MFKEIIIPVDVYRPKLGLEVEGHNDFINAVYVSVRACFR